MRSFLSLIIFLIITTIWGNTADAGCQWNKIGMDSNTVIYISPNYEQDKSLFTLTGKDLYRSLDEGRTWNKISNMPVWQVQIANDKSMYAMQGVTAQQLAIYKFQTSQEQWDKICDVPPNTKVFAVLANNNMLISKPYESSSFWQILRTQNNGLSWDDTGYNHGGYLFEPVPDGTVFTIEKETNFGGKGSDFGARWKMLNKTYELNKFFISPNYLIDNTVFAIINNKSICSSSDGGENWFKSMNGIEGNGDFVSLAFSFNYKSDKTVYAADKSGHVFVSRSGSSEWSSLDVELQRNNKLNNIVVLPNNKVLAGTNDGIYEVAYTAPPVNLQTVTAKFKIGQMTYKINGNVWYMDAAPYTENDRTFVPVRYLAYALGITDSNIYWDKVLNEVTISKDNTVIKLTPGSRFLIVNGKPVLMDVLPQINMGRIMLPARWVAEAFGAKVAWDDPERTVIIEYSQREKNN